MTSIEWLIEKIGIIDIKDPYYKELFEEAQRIHKQEIIETRENGIIEGIKRTNNNIMMKSSIPNT